MRAGERWKDGDGRAEMEEDESMACLGVEKRINTVWRDTSRMG